LNNIIFSESTTILKKIYKEMFLGFRENIINIFLCGQSESVSNSIRELIYKKLKNDPKYEIIFPEWLFCNLLVDRKLNKNLLTLEGELAQDVDVIIIPIEGCGTMAELGAFSANKKLTPKIIVLNDQKYKTCKSFITIGPVKLVKEKNKHNVIYYNPDEMDELTSSVLSRIKALGKISNPLDLGNIFGLSRFVLYVIALYQKINKKEIVELLKNFKPNIRVDYLDPCIDFQIYNNKYVKMEKDDHTEYFSLTNDGHNYVYELVLNKFSKKKIFSSTRAHIINNRYNIKKKYNFDEEQKRFLGV